MPRRPTVVLVRTLALTALLALAATVAQADPRWWWNDQQLTSTAADSLTPHLAGVGGGSGAAGGGTPILITWAEVPPGETDLEIWLTATFDAGCTFCTPQRLTDNDADDTNPRVATLVLLNGDLSFAVAFERRQGVFLAYDATTVNMRPSVGGPCAAFARVGTEVITNDRYVTLAPTSSGARAPDIGAAGFNSVYHFHAVWLQPDAAGPGDLEVMTAHDLTGLQGLGWTAMPPKVLTTAIAPPFVVSEPRIACDLLTDPNPAGGGPTASRSGVNVVFGVQGGVVPTWGLVGLRSTDSGATFSPTGTQVDAPPGPVSDGVPNPGPPALPAIDAAYSPFGFDQPAWIMTSWDDRAGLTSPGIRADARRLQTPDGPLPDWQSPDEAVSAPAAAGAGDTTIAAIYSFNSGSAPVFVGWEDGSFGQPDLVYRAGVLDDTAADVIDFGSFPFPAVRALDPVVSTDLLLTHCVYDDPTGGCRSTRTVGAAVDVEFFADLEAVFAVWSDSRTGNQEIFFKRTDQRVFNQPPRLTAECSGLDVARINVSFDTVATCPAPFSAERMTRYLVYYGTNLAGPYQNAASPIEIIDDGALGAVVSLSIDGLTPGLTWHVIVVPEDEARNLNPPTFDPTADGAMRYPNEESILVPTPCRPDVALNCVRVGDHCASDPLIDMNGVLDFGELFDIDLTVINTGNAPLVGWMADLVVTGATVVTPPGGLLSVPDVPANASSVVRVTLQLPDSATATCGDPVDLTLANQRAAGPQTWPDAPLANCDAVLGDPLGGCGDCATTFQVCLYRSDVTGLLPHVPARNVVYLVPATAEGISLQGPTYQCPFADGDLEQDATAGTNGVALVLYQVNQLIDTLRLARSGTTIRFDF